MERKKIFNIANYKDSSERKFGMLFKTEDEAKTFCNYLDSLGKQWSSAMSYAKNTCRNNEPIIYYFNRNMYEPLGELTRELLNDIILTFSDFDWSLYQHSNPAYIFQLDDLKDGQIVKVRGGQKYIKIKNYLINLTQSISIVFYAQSLESRVDRYNDIIAVYELDSPASLDTLLRATSSENESLTCIWNREDKEKPIELTIEALEDYFGHPIKIVRD